MGAFAYQPTGTWPSEVGHGTGQDDRTKCCLGGLATLGAVTEGRGLWYGVLGWGPAEGSGRLWFCEQETRVPRLDRIGPCGSGAPRPLALV